MLYDLSLFPRSILYATLAALLMYYSMRSMTLRPLFCCLSIYFMQALMVTASALWWPGMEQVIRILLTPVLVVAIYVGLVPVWSHLRQLWTLPRV